MNKVIYTGPDQRIVLTDGRRLKIREGMILVLTDKELSDLSISGDYKALEEKQENSEATETETPEPEKPTHDNAEGKTKKGGGKKR